MQREYYKEEELLEKEIECFNLRKLYQENLESLYASVGQPLHDHYSKLEYKLHKEEVRLRSRFPPYHKYALPADPCYVQRPYACDNCTGFYRDKIPKFRRRALYELCRETDIGAIKCEYKPRMTKKQMEERCERFLDED